MAYRDEKEALKARVDSLEQELEHAKEHEILVFPRKTPRQKRIQLAVTAVGLAVVVGAGFGVRAWAVRVVDREIATAWGDLSECLVGDPLAANETASARVRRVSLAYAKEGRGESADTRWPQRCESPSHQLHVVLHDNGRADDDIDDPSRVSEALAAKLKHGVIDDPLLDMVDTLWTRMQKRGVVPSVSVATHQAPPPANPLHLADLAGAALTKVFTPMTSLYVESLVGPDRHVLIAPPEGATVLCTLAASSGALKCRDLPGALAEQRDLRLLGTADADAAPLVFAGHDGEGGIYRSDTGERIATARAYSGYVSASGYAAVQTWPADDGRFEVFQQDHPGAEITKGVVKPEAQTQPVTQIHRSRLLWDRLVLQLVDKKHLDKSPWIAVRALPEDGLAGAFPRVAALNWVNTHITGCKGSSGMVVRVGPREAMLMFFDGERWQGPLPARGLGELVCDGGNGMFLDDSWPVHAKRCTPAGCDDLSAAPGQWPTEPKGKLFASDFAGGNLVVAWVTANDGVRFRIGPPERLGAIDDVVVLDDLVDEKGTFQRKSVVTGLGVMSAGQAAIVLVATSAGVRAIRLHPDGKFEPAPIAR